MEVRRGLHRTKPALGLGVSSGKMASDRNQYKDIVIYNGLKGERTFGHLSNGLQGLAFGHTMLKVRKVFE